MKYKVAMTLTTVLLLSMLSFSNRCGRACEGQEYLSAATPAVSTSCETDAAPAEEAGTFPLLRMAATL